jgi:hypothetical protein
MTVVVLSSWRRVTVPHDSPDDGYESQASGNESLMRILCVNLIVRGFGGGRIRVPCAWWTGGDETQAATAPSNSQEPYTKESGTVLYHPEAPSFTVGDLTSGWAGVFLVIQFGNEFRVYDG